MACRNKGLVKEWRGFIGVDDSESNPVVCRAELTPHSPVYRPYASTILVIFTDHCSLLRQEYDLWHMRAGCEGCAEGVFTLGRCQECKISVYFTWISRFRCSPLQAQLTLEVALTVTLTLNPPYRPRMRWQRSNRVPLASKIAQMLRRSSSFCGGFEQ